MGETMNIITPQPAMPRKAVCQLKKLYLGRQLGAEASSIARQAKLLPKYDRRKKMDVIRAIWFSEGINRTICNAKKPRSENNYTQKFNIKLIKVSVPT